MKLLPAQLSALAELTVPTGNAQVPDNAFGGATFTFIDTETTGVVPGEDRICEIALVRIQGNDVRTFHSLVNPGISIPPQASAVHHITDEMVASSPKLFDLAATIARLVDGAIVVAHHAHFDRVMLAAELGTEVDAWQWLCSCRLARHLLPGAPSYSNQVLRYWLKTNPSSAGLGAHRAIDDVYVSIETFRHLLVRASLLGLNRADDLLQLAASPIQVATMPFGAHEGTRLSDLPHDYVAWALGKVPNRKGITDLDPDLRWSLEQVHQVHETKVPAESHASSAPTSTEPPALADNGITVLDFGREHRGKPLAIVPTRYLAWMVEARPRCAPELMMAVEAELTRRQGQEQHGHADHAPQVTAPSTSRANLFLRRPEFDENTPPWEDPPAALLAADAPRSPLPGGSTNAPSAPAKTIPMPAAPKAPPEPPAWSFHDDGSIPSHRDEIFVFGSNLAGRHGKGAAQEARIQFGAVPGLGHGAMGRSYAIPTKHVDLKILAVETISVYVNRFLEHARKNPQHRFFVTRIGCGLAMYSDAQIAPLFARAPANCSFAKQWKPHLYRALGIEVEVPKDDLSGTAVRRSPRPRGRKKQAIN